MAQILSLSDLTKLNIIHQLLKIGSLNYSAAQEDYLANQIRCGSDYPGLIQSLLDMCVSDYASAVKDAVLNLFVIKELKVLNLKNCEHVTIGTVATILQRCVTISVLKLHNIPHLFAELLPAQPDSGQTSSENRSVGPSIPPGKLHSTFGPCNTTLTNLSYLDLSGCTTFTDGILQHFLMRCHNLQHLNIKRCLSLTENAFNFSSHRDTTTAAGNQHTLRCHLHTVILTGNKQMTSITLSDIMHLFHSSLQSLDLSATGVGCKGMLILCGFNVSTTNKLLERLHVTDPDDDFIRRDPEIESIFETGQCLCAPLGQSSPPDPPCQHRTSSPADLHMLNIQNSNLHCISCSHACLSVVFNNHPSLRNVEVSNMSGDETLDVMLRNCAQLRKLTLLESTRLTDEAFSTLPDMCPVLEELDLRGVSFMGDDGLVRICEGYANKRLKKLMLAECQITDRGLQDIATHLSDQIQMLDLSWCDDVTDVGLVRIAESCKQLRGIVLRTLPITKHMLDVLADNCPFLTELNISSGCQTELQDETLRRLSEKLPLLEVIDISWNSEVTDEAVRCLLRNCCHLRKAVFAGVKRLTYKPFLPIISDVKQWERSKSFLRLKLFERAKRQRNVSRGLELSDEGSSDEEYDNVCIPTRSTTYAPRLKLLDLCSCDFVNDYVLSEITVVCHGSLVIMDYYNVKIPASLTHLAQFKSLNINDYE